MDKRWMAVWFCLIILGPMAYGQNFTYTASVTEKLARPDQLTQFYSEIQNLEPNPVNFWIEMHTNVPAEWTVNFCTGWLCWPPWVTLDTTSVIAGNSMDSILVDIYADSFHVEGWVTMVVYPRDHFELADSITFYAYLPNAVGGNPEPPKGFALLDAYPNPFNAREQFAFSLAAATDVDLRIFDLAGREVAKLFSGRMGAGEHQINWRPLGLSGGIYFVRLSQGSSRIIRKVAYLP